MTGGRFKDMSTGGSVDRERMLSLTADYLRDMRKYKKVRVESWGLKCLDQDGKMRFIMFRARGSKYSNFSYSTRALTDKYDEIFHVVDFEDGLFGTLIIYSCGQKALEDLLFTNGFTLSSNPEVTLLKDRDLKKISTSIEIRF